MTIIEFFKLQAKNLNKDVKTIYIDEEGYYDFKPKYFEDIYKILCDWNFSPEEIGENKQQFSLMKAQHIIAQWVGCKNWSDLIHSSNERLELKKSLFEHRDDMFYNGSWNEPFIQSWLLYEEMYLNNGKFDDSAKLEIYKLIYLKENNK